MEINKQNWHAKFYKASYNKLTDNFCEYFWKLLLAVILLPLTWLGYSIPAFRKGFDSGLKDYFLITIFLYFLIFTGMGLGVELIGDSSILKATVLGLLIILLGVGIIIGITILVIYIIEEGLPKYFHNKKTEPNSGTSNGVNIIKERWKAFRGKYCPKISWK